MKARVLGLLISASRLALDYQSCLNCFFILRGFKSFHRELAGPISSPEDFLADPNLEEASPSYHAPLRFPLSLLWPSTYFKTLKGLFVPPGLVEPWNPGSVLRMLCSVKQLRKNTPILTVYRHLSPGLKTLVSQHEVQGGVWQRSASLSSKTCNFSQPQASLSQHAQYSLLLDASLASLL